jgi:hypothetical protein
MRSKGTSCGGTAARVLGWTVIASGDTWSSVALNREPSFRRILSGFPGSSFSANARQISGPTICAWSCGGSASSAASPHATMGVIRIPFTMPS